MSISSNLVAIRDALPGDYNFILATWLRGLYYGDSWFREMPKDIFMENYHKILTALLKLPGIMVKVACLIEDPEVILGYIVYKGATVHWVFVKSAWRKIGIAKRLFPQDTTTVTHLTKLGLSLMRKYPSLKFNPFALT